jgi:ABC-type glycerol-3-phosphate transport system permease component
VRALRSGVLLLLVLVIAFPVYITLTTAFLSPQAVAAGRLWPDPREFTLGNFSAALQSIPLLRQYGVSLAVTVLQAGAQVVLAAAAGYALVFPTWRGRGLAFVLFLGTLAIPGETTVIPNYETVTGLGLRDTVLAVALPFLCAAYPVFLLRQAFSDLPREVWEAATLDGAGHLRALFQIVLPMARGHLATAALWAALSAWNGYFWPLLITDSPDARTVQVGLSQLVVAEGSTPGVVYAGTLVVLLPTLLLVLCGQRFLVRGLAARNS